MKGEILFLCHRIPYPPDRGDKIRSWNLLKALAKLAPVHVGCFADDDRDMGFAEALDTQAKSAKVVLRNVSTPIAGMRGLLRGQPLTVSLFDHPDLHRWMREKIAGGQIGAVICFSVQMAQYLPARLPQGMRFVMDFVDFDSEKYAAYGREGHGPMAWVHAREGRVLAAYERAVAQRADASLFVSDAEAALFRARMGMGDRVMTLNNGVDTAFFDPAATFPLVDLGSGPLIVFTGQMDYRPNVEAVHSFAAQAMPVIRAHRPDARFAIVGRNPTAEVEALASADPSVIVTGGVDDVRGWLAAADIVVAPLRIARGVQNKVLEAMAMARPVVASVQAAEGISAERGRDLLVGRDAAEEAALVLDLLAAPERARAMGLAARARVIDAYGWDAAMAPLAQMLGRDAAKEKAA